MQPEEIDPEKLAKLSASLEEINRTLTQLTRAWARFSMYYVDAIPRPEEAPNDPTLPNL